MKTYTLLTTALLLASGTVGLAGGKADTSIDARAAFSRLKGLVGEWEGTTSMGKAHLSYELTGAGTTLVEKETAEKMPSMMTVYHLDGDRLILTHYCMAGNQPRMQAESYDPQTGEIRFRFLDATNLAGKNAGHMHNVTLKLPDNDHLASAWEFYEGGKSKMTEQFQYTRIH